MLVAYCDESDTLAGGQQLLVLAGYLANEADWQAFITDWNVELLKPFRIPHFHAKDIRSRNAKLYRHLDLAERRQLLGTGSKLIVKHTRAGAIVYMRPADWRHETTSS